MSSLALKLRGATVAIVSAALVLTASPALAAEDPTSSGTGTTQSPTPDPDPPTPPAPVITTTTPTISGKTAVGSVLTARVTGWTPMPALTYQWLRNGSAIGGATRASYTLAAADRGTRLSVRVTGTKSGYPTVSATSAATAVIAAGTLRPSAGMTGSNKVAGTLKALPGNWGVSGVTLKYQWYANGRAIRGATRTTLKVTPAMYGKRIAVRITGSKPGYTTAAKTATASKKAAAGTIKLGKVAISGTTVQGRKLTAKVSGWPKGVKLSYQWYVGGTRIRGASKSTFTVPMQAVRKKIRVRVTARATGYKSAVKTSAWTKTINKIKLDSRCLAKGRIICADKNTRKVYRVQNGVIIDAYDARFGRAGLRTRNGVWPIYYKSARQWSALYNVWMPYAEFFSGGQGVHYSAEFASKGYMVGSHGCINLRDYAGARRIFNWARVGDKVVVVGRDR